jgi:hypothetical protein
MPVPPQEYTPSLSHSPSAAPPPFWGFNNRPDQNSQSSVEAMGLPPGELTSSTHSLTWRELLTGLTTCLFNHGPDNPLLQPASTQFHQGEDNSKAQYSSGNGSNHNSVRHNMVLASTNMLGFTGKHRSTSRVTGFRGV